MYQGPQSEERMLPDATTTTSNFGIPAAVIQVNRPVYQHQTAASYDVFIAPSGAVFEFGPATMRVRGQPTPCDRVAFVQHCRVHGADPKTHATVCGVKVALW